MRLWLDQLVFLYGIAQPVEFVVQGRSDIGWPKLPFVWRPWLLRQRERGAKSVILGCFGRPELGRRLFAGRRQLYRFLLVQIKHERQLCGWQVACRPV